MRRLTTVVAAAATTLLLAATPAAAHGGKPAPKPPTVTEITGGLDGPLSLAVGPKGTTYVTQNFPGLLTAVDKRGRTSVVHRSTGGVEVGAVSYRDRVLTFAETTYDAMQNPSGSTLRTLRVDAKGKPSGKARTVADIRAYENDRNPDGRVSYGLRDLPADCVAQLPEGFPGEYTGLEDSHPYATTRGWGTTFVADAGMNAILSVSDRGRIRTVAVLPPQPAVITPEAAEAFGLPGCVAGHTYWFESVPTDVEVGPWGQLYVTTLPGGPEDDSLGARGKVYRVSPLLGTVREVADGFVSATDLAVSPKGDIYVAEMFGGRISKVTHGEPRTVVDVAFPGAVEWSDGDLLATTNALPYFGPPDQPPPPPEGTLVHVDLTKGHGHR